MAHSLQHVGERFESFVDADLIAIVILLADALSSALDKYLAIAPHVDRWRSDLSCVGPGMIDLRLDEVVGVARSA